MSDLHLLDKATVMIAALVLTPIAIWITNLKDKKLQDMEDDLILGGKSPEETRDRSDEEDSGKD